MTDEQLLAYALDHSETERALFHREHVIRIWRLAGLELRELFEAFPDACGQVDLLPMFICVKYHTMEPLVSAARQLLKQTRAQATVEVRQRPVELDVAASGAWAGIDDPIGPFDSEAPLSGLRSIPPQMSYPCCAPGGCPSHNHVAKLGLVCKECLN